MNTRLIALHVNPPVVSANQLGTVSLLEWDNFRLSLPNGLDRAAFAALPDAETLQALDGYTFNANATASSSVIP